jgi:hypothetical protein
VVDVLRRFRIQSIHPALAVAFFLVVLAQRHVVDVFVTKWQWDAGHCVDGWVCSAAWLAHLVVASADVFVADAVVDLIGFVEVFLAASPLEWFLEPCVVIWQAHFD